MPRLGRARPAAVYVHVHESAVSSGSAPLPSVAAPVIVMHGGRGTRRRGSVHAPVPPPPPATGITASGSVALNKLGVVGPVYPLPPSSLVMVAAGGNRRHRPVVTRIFHPDVIPSIPGYNIGSAGLPPIATSGTVTVPLTPGEEPFPLGLLPVKGELQVNGAWTDVTDFIYQRSDITMEGGRPDETTGIQTCSMTLTLDNRDGRFSPLNTQGAYWPYIARNIQMRLSVAATFAASGLSWTGYRFWGETSEWLPQQDTSGNDQYCALTVSGVLLRYGKAAAIGSPLARYYSSLAGSFAPYAAWPCTDGSQATEMGSILGGVPGMGITGTPQFGSDASFGGSDSLPVISSSEWHGQTIAAENPPGSGSLTETVPGTYQWTCPPGVTSVAVSETGAGAGGEYTSASQGGGGGGGGESAANSVVKVTPGVTYTYVVPAGGIPATSTSSATAGGNATFAGDLVTVTAHGGQPGQNGTGGGGGGLGGTGSSDHSHQNGGQGGAGETLAEVTSTRTLTGSAGASGGASAGQAGSASQVWIAPVGTTTVTVEAVGPGGGGGSSYGTTSGGTGGGGGAYAAGTIDVTAGQPYTFFAGNGGAGASAGAVPGHRGETGGGTFVIGDSSSVSATGGAGGGPAGGYGEGGTATNGTGNPGGQGGTGALSTTAAGGGGGGGGNRGFPGNPGGAGGNGSGRSPGGGNGAGGKGGWGQIYTGSGAGSGQTAGQTGNQTGSPGGGGGAAGATKQQTDAAGGGGPGQIVWSWTNDAATGGGGGSSAGTSAAGGAGQSNGTGGVAPAGGGAGGDMDMTGASPGGGGGGMDPAGTAPGAGAPGQVSLAWSGGSTSPVAADIIRFLLHVGTSGAADGAVIARAVTFGTVQTLDVIYRTASGGTLEFKGYTGATTYFDETGLFTDLNGVPVCVSFSLNSTGSGATWNIQAIEPGAATVLGDYTGDLSGISIGYVSDVYCDPAQAITDSATSAGWFTVQSYADTLVNISQVLAGFAGELVSVRLARLCGEEGITFTLLGADSDTPQMAAQQNDTLMNVFQSGEDADRGQLFESRDSLGLSYRTRVSMCGQSPGAVLDWQGGQLAQPVPAPVTDGMMTRNDITLTRINGSSVNAQLNDGTLMSISDPPAGAGDNAYSLTVYLYSDTQLPYIVAFMLAVGTCPDYRFPQVAFDFARTASAAVAPDIAALTAGDWLQTTDAPAVITPANIDQLVWGWTETINALKWQIVFNLVPASPYATGPQIINANYDFSDGTADWTSYQGTISLTEVGDD